MREVLAVSPSAQAAATARVRKCTLQLRHAAGLAAHARSGYYQTIAGSET
jgi:hypothetical protein